MSETKLFGFTIDRLSSLWWK